MDSRKPLDGLAVSLLGVLCFVWALQPIVLKAAAHDISPMLQIGLRSGIAAALAAAVMWFKGERFAWRDGTLLPGLATGVLFTVEFILVAEAIRYTKASHVVLFLYTAPIFAALALHVYLPEERLRAGQWSGIALAFLGVAFALLSNPGHDNPQFKSGGVSTLVGDGIALLSGVFWGATTTVIRCSKLERTSSSKILVYHLTMAFLVMCGLAWAMGQATFKSTALAWNSLLFQALVISFASFFGWLWLLKRHKASSLGAFSFLTPMLGMMLAAVLLDEPIDPAFPIGAVLVVLGVFLVTGHGILRRS